MSSRYYPERPFLAASCAVFRDGKVLLASRAAPPNDHTYSLPGGMVETGERVEEAALRELHEETGIRAEIVGFTGYSQVIAPDDAGKTRAHFVIVSFAGHWVSGDGEPGEELPAMGWYTLAEAEKMTLTPGLMPILRKGLALIEGGE
jgi:ADP-ribose pyrophosphatase YjhB (NUDIX family)